MAMKSIEINAWNVNKNNDWLDFKSDTNNGDYIKDYINTKTRFLLRL